MKKSWILLTLCGLAVQVEVLAQAPQPPLDANGWNFVLVQAFENEPSKSNNLSVTGLNHALRFGQLLSGLTAGKQNQVRQVYALTSAAAGETMTPLESIEPYAVLNNLSVKVQKLNPGDAHVYDSPGYFVEQILANGPRGTYIMAMPPAMLQEIAKTLAGASEGLRNSHQYLVVSGNNKPFRAAHYEDGLPNVAEYPKIPLPARSRCSQPPITIRAKAPAGLHPYTSQSVFLVRHVEAHPTGSFENGNYVCEGQWRALGANDILLENMRNRRPDYVYTSNTANIIDCGAACSYIRPALTVAPFAIQFGLPLTVAPFQWEDAADLAEALFNRDSPQFKHPATGASILVGWEHAHIEEAVKYLLTVIYQDPAAAAKVPAWNFGDYDTIWEISTDQDGAATFTNSCEGISSAALPTTCPAFFQ